MANKNEKQAHRIIALGGDDIEWFDQLVERQDVAVQRAITDLLHFDALAIIDLLKDQPDKLEEALASQSAVTRKTVLHLLQAQGLAAEKREKAAGRRAGFVPPDGRILQEVPEGPTCDVVPEKELVDDAEIKDTPGVESAFWHENEPAQDNVPVEYLAKAEPDLNEVRDKVLKQDVPSKGPFCPEKPLIAAPSADRPIHIVITSGDKTVTIDL